MPAEFSVRMDDEDIIVDVRPTARIGRAAVGIVLISFSSVYLPLYAYRSLTSTTWASSGYELIAYLFFFLSMIGLIILYREVSGRRITFSRRAIGVERRLFGIGIGLTWYSTASMGGFGFARVGRGRGMPTLLFRSGRSQFVVLLAPVERAKVMTLLNALAVSGLVYPSDIF
jgi:hypothetical protein